jgi:hypothetical protein
MFVVETEMVPLFIRHLLHLPRQLVAVVDSQRSLTHGVINYPPWIGPFLTKSKLFSLEGVTIGLVDILMHRGRRL